MACTGCSPSTPAISPVTRSKWCSRLRWCLEDGRASDHPRAADDAKMGFRFDDWNNHAGGGSLRTQPGFQDFVIAHELLHLRVPTHGRLFKALMTAHVPNWRTFDVARHRPRIG